MAQRICWLGGLAILAVVLHHSFNSWDLNAAFYFAQAGDPMYSVLGMLKRAGLELTRFSVPSFLFISGFFTGYANRSRRSNLQHRLVKNRITGLLIPYMFWQLFYFAASWMVGGTPRTLQQYTQGLVAGDDITGYYFVPLLVQFYVVAVPLVGLTRNWPLQTLIGAAAVQLATLTILYLSAIVGLTGVTEAYAIVARNWAFVATWAFFFPFGLFFGLKSDRLQQAWSRLGPWIVAGTIAFGVGSVVEGEWLLRVLHRPWDHSVMRIPSSLYAIGFILTFLSAPDLKLPVPNFFAALNTFTFGIFLLHVKVLEYTIRLFIALEQWFLSPGQDLALWLWLIATLLMSLSLAVAVPVGIMVAIRRSPVKRLYSVLFG